MRSFQGRCAARVGRGGHPIHLQSHHGGFEAHLGGVRAQRRRADGLLGEESLCQSQPAEGLMKPCVLCVCGLGEAWGVWGSGWVQLDSVKPFETDAKRSVDDA